MKTTEYNQTAKFSASSELMSEARGFAIENGWALADLLRTALREKLARDTMHLAGAVSTAREAEHAHAG